MEFTMSFSWWWIPTFVTVTGLVWALFIYEDEPGMFSGMANFILLVPVLFVSMVLWIIFAFLK